MRLSADVARCPSCGAAVDPRGELCSYCNSPLAIFDRVPLDA